MDVAAIRTKYELPNRQDNLMETGPTTTKSAGSLNVSIGFGSSGVSGTIGFSVDLSDYAPILQEMKIIQMIKSNGY